MPERQSIETRINADMPKRLRHLADFDSRAGEPLGILMREAADEIDRLRKLLVKAMLGVK